MTTKTKTDGTESVRLKIPTATRELIGTLYTAGDYTAISVKAFGTNDRRQLVRAAMANGEGAQQVVEHIVKFYNGKNEAAKKLN
jgi:hypothetical protein